VHNMRVHHEHSMRVIENPLNQLGSLFRMTNRTTRRLPHERPTARQVLLESTTGWRHPRPSWRVCGCLQHRQKPLAAAGLQRLGVGWSLLPCAHGDRGLGQLPRPSHGRCGQPRDGERAWESAVWFGRNAVVPSEHQTADLPHFMAPKARL
jgi:hypothetical protein